MYYIGVANWNREGASLVIVLREGARKVELGKENLCGEDIQGKEQSCPVADTKHQQWGCPLQQKQQSLAPIAAILLHVGLMHVEGVSAAITVKQTNESALEQRK